MADLNLVNGFISEGQREFMCSNTSMDELQLAALLGKTLLEKNSELDIKLRRLQDFAEDTLVLNQSLNRQLTESRESLRFSNKTCEQLEARIDELEHSNSLLQRQSVHKQSIIDHKTERIDTLEDELAQLKAQNEYLREQRSLTDKTSSLEANEPKSKLNEGKARERSKSCQFEQPPEVDSVVIELTGRVQKLTYQKEKAERRLVEVLAESETFSKSLEKAECEIDDLTLKMSSYEESLEGMQTTPLSTPKHSRFSSTSTPTSHTSFTLPPLTESHTHSSQSMEEESPDSGLSLFNELDSEFNSLRQHYNKLVQGCTCSASIYHKNWSKTDQPEERKSEVKDIDKPFKELFEEVFATLKQTAQVADRLIERKSALIREQ